MEAATSKDRICEVCGGFIPSGVIHCEMYSVVCSDCHRKCEYCTTYGWGEFACKHIGVLKNAENILKMPIFAQPSEALMRMHGQKDLTQLINTFGEGKKKAATQRGVEAGNTYILLASLQALIKQKIKRR